MHGLLRRVSVCMRVIQTDMCPGTINIPGIKLGMQ